MTILPMVETNIVKTLVVEMHVRKEVKAIEIEEIVATIIVAVATIMEVREAEIEIATTVVLKRDFNLR